MSKAAALHRALRKAKEIADSIAEREEREGFHCRVAMTVRKTGCENLFGSYVPDAIKVQELKRKPLSPDQLREEEQLSLLEAEAKRLFLQGDQAQAEAIYLSAEELRDDHLRRGILGARFQFLDWLLEAESIKDATEFVAKTDWEHPWSHVCAVARVAEANMGLGQRDEGLNLLLALRPSPTSPHAAQYFTYVAKFLWVSEAQKDAVSWLRDAANAAVIAAQTNDALPLYGYIGGEPLGIAELQMDADDLQGARETLQRIQQLSAPLEYNPPPPPPKLPPDFKGKHIYVSSRGLKPSAKRWFGSQTPRAAALSRGGFEDQAMDILQEVDADQLAILVAVTKGLARRFALEAAFHVLDRISTAPVTVRPRVPFSAFASGRAQTPPESSEQGEQRERKEAVRQAACWIAENAWMAGDMVSFRRAEAIALGAAPDRWRMNRDWYMPRYIKRLGVRDPDAALNAVEALKDPKLQILCLIAIAEANAGMIERLQGGLGP
jgi:hypothetical protein